MLPSEFIQSFEKQYPQPELVYTLPESLDRAPALKALIVATVEGKKELSLYITDEGGVTYDMLNKVYWTFSNPNSKTVISTNGYKTLFDKLYKSYGGNISPRTFSYILDDLTEVNGDIFTAGLVMQQGSYGMKKAIALNKAWMEFCLQTSTDFTMDYTEYNKVILELDEE